MASNDQIPLCRQVRPPGEPWKPCPCPVHDHVAELLGIVSISGRDFRPDSTPEQCQVRSDYAQKRASRARSEAETVKSLMEEAKEARIRAEEAYEAGFAVDFEAAMSDFHGAMAKMEILTSRMEKV